MSLLSLWRVDRKVPSSAFIVGTILVTCFLIVWFLIPASDRISADSIAGNVKTNSHDLDENAPIQDSIELEDGEHDTKGSGQSSPSPPKENSEIENGDVPPTESTFAHSELTVEVKKEPSNWSTQAEESNEEKRSLNTTQEAGDSSITTDQFNKTTEGISHDNEQSDHIIKWNLCKWEGAMDYIPCLDNKEAIKRLPSTRRFQHRERHCPSLDKYPMCLVPHPKGYKVSMKWPRSRNEIWLDNVPHTKLVSYKKDQNWVKLVGDKLFFPGGGTQFKYGASKYIESLEKHVADIAWGKHTRVVLDIGCGVASFGGFLFDKDVITMSFAPKDEHEAQVQLALERGIPAISAVMGTQRLPFPSNAFDLAHCARCRIHWNGDGGKWLVEVNRVLRPGGYFVWSATPVYRKNPEDVEFWKAMVAVTKSMCWNLTVKATAITSGVGFAVYQKPTSNSCYERRSMNEPPMCSENANSDAAWYTPLEACMEKVPTDIRGHGRAWPPTWPERVDSTPSWLKESQKSLFGMPADEEMQTDTDHWKRVVSKSYFTGMGIDWGQVRNVMDMKAGYGGFAAALLRTSAWVMNVVPIDEPDTLPVIFDRGLMGIYHDWCESFSTYPRTYDLLHADHVFEHLISRCKPIFTLLEMDRILRPQGWIIIREKSDIVKNIRPIIDSLHWKVGVSYFDGEERLLVVQKTFWRPEADEVESK